MIQTASVFAQLLSLISRQKFQQSIRRHQAEKAAKGFSCWSQFVAMLFCQVGGAHSLREICGGLATAMGKLQHLGLKAAPKRSTLSYANTHRPWELFEDVFHSLMEQARGIAARQKRSFRFKNPLRILDSSTIHLCREIFDWAKFGRTKGAVKLHLMLDHQGCLPSWVYISKGKMHDVTPVKCLKLPAGTIVAMDRAYNDYALFNHWCDDGVFFVTRMKSNTVYRVVKHREVPLAGPVLSDEIIVLDSIKGRRACPHRLRRVCVWDEKNQRELVLLSNQLTFAAGTIGRIYKERWQIELFFKAIKQNLKIKTFVGTSENAVRIQIYTALIAMLLIKMLQLRSSFGWSLSNLAAMIRMNLLTYRNLWTWLDTPFTPPESIPPDDLPLLANCSMLSIGGPKIRRGAKRT